MSYAGTYRASDNSDRPKLLYGLKDKPPLKDAIFVAFQHVWAIFILIVTPGLLITRALGLNILREVKMDNRAFIILAISLSAGLGVTFLPEALEHFPSGVQSILESGIATGSICALGLNIIVPQTEEEPVSERVEVMEDTAAAKIK